MPLNNYIPGINDAAQYQVAGIPFTWTSSGNATYTLTFKRLAKAVTITSTGTNSTVGFGMTNEETFALPASWVRLDVKCNKLVIVVAGGNTVSVCAELTGIPPAALGTLDADDFGSVA